MDAQGQPTQPADATVAAGATAHFIAMAYGLNTYQWQRSNDSGTTWIDVPGATDWALDVVSVQTTDDGSLFRLRAQTFDTSTLTHITITSRSARLSVTGQTPGLAAALDVPSVSVGQGSTQNVTLTLTPSNGFTGTVSWVVNNLPAGMTLASGSVNVAGPPPVTQALSLGVDGSVFAASYSLMIAVSAASIPPQMLPLQVTVTGAPDFSLVARPSNIVLTPGGQAGGFDVTLTPLNNFTGAVRLSLSGVTTPPLTVTPDVPFTVPVGPTAPVTQHFSVAVDGTAPIPASYSFDVIASIGATLHTARVNVTTQQPVSGYIQVGSNPRISASDARTTNGAGYSARFDFGQGTFGIGLDSTAGQGVTLGMGSGPGPTFIFTNRSPTPLVIPAGALNVKFNGRYTHVRGGQLQVVLTMVAQTSAGGPEPIAIVNHTISDPQPTLSKTESNGATVTIHQADMFALDVELGMPQLTVPVGGSLVFWYVLEAHPASGGDSMDFTTAGGRLCLHLPIGTWDNNVGVPIDWCQ